MKKLHFSLLAILFALFAMVSFTACSSDDEDTPSTEDVKTYIIGMWQPTHVTGYYWDENGKPAKVDMDIDIDDVDAFEFGLGGTYNEYYWTGNKWKTDSSGDGYTISGNKLTIYEEEDCINVFDVYTIQSINLTTMVLKNNLDGNAPYPRTITFKKIK